VTRPGYAADGRDTAVLATLSGQLNERRTLALIPFMYWFQEFHSQHPDYPVVLQESQIMAIPCWQHEMHNSHVDKGSGVYL
jgi:hypothetical protein